MCPCSFLLKQGHIKYIKIVCLLNLDMDLYAFSILMKVSLRLFQKRVVRTRFDIYCFISNNVYIYIPAKTFLPETFRY
jgi:hypothetical protein